MAKRKLGIGMIGAGGIASGVHATGWLEHPDVRVVAVCDIDEERATRLAEKVGAKHVVSDFRRLVELDGIDAVDVCTPNKVHTPAVLAALEAGKHVVCEKPLAVTVDEVLRMGRLADARRGVQRRGLDRLAGGRVLVGPKPGPVRRAAQSAARAEATPHRGAARFLRLRGERPAVAGAVHRDGQGDRDPGRDLPFPAGRQRGDGRRLTGGTGRASVGVSPTHPASLPTTRVCSTGWGCAAATSPPSSPYASKATVSNVPTSGRVTSVQSPARRTASSTSARSARARAQGWRTRRRACVSGKIRSKGREIPPE